MSRRAYERVWYDGEVLNRRSLASYLQAVNFLSDFYKVPRPAIMQGSYSGGVEASAGTHNGGGAIDIDYMGSRKNPKVVSIFRECGWAMWYRPYRPELWGAHNHGIMIGDREMSSGAESQVHDYFAHLDGLASHSFDPTPRPNPIPVFIYPLRIVDLSVLRKEAGKTRNWDPNPSVRVVQRALNKKRGADLPVDGIFGPNTRRVFKRYELQMGGDGDGIPGEYATRRLGLARYKVKA